MTSKYQLELVLNWDCDRCDEDCSRGWPAGRLPIAWKSPFSNVMITFLQPHFCKSLFSSAAVNYTLKCCQNILSTSIQSLKEFLAWHLFLVVDGWSEHGWRLDRRGQKNFLSKFVTLAALQLVDRHIINLELYPSWSNFLHGFCSSVGHVDATASIKESFVSNLN